MMGAGKPDEGYGVRDFKAKFGGELVEHGRYLYLCKPMMYKLGKKIIEQLKKRK
jgi:lipid II:glycine glycyltransferase (peptidoglycan interpeptide bridge formation enzyme)